MYKLKQKPEDFIVTEKSKINLVSEGKFAYFCLQKKNQNTLDVVKKIARRLGVPEKKIGFAGSKDKLAVTEQVISLLAQFKKKAEQMEIKDAKLLFRGYGQEPVTLGDLEGNYFEIIVRNLDKNSSKKMERTEYCENYFDEQRFSKQNVTIGKHLLKKEFAEALKYIDHQTCQEHLQKHKTDFVGALKKIPLRLLKMYLHAYQSYLWNETLTDYVKISSVHELKIKSYSQGKLVFCKNPYRFLNLNIPLIGFDCQDLTSEGKIQKIIEKIMQKEKITFKDFVIKQIPELSLEGGRRAAFMPVTEMFIQESIDELNSGKKKVKIKFFLPRGSYATMVIKRLLD